LAWGFCWGSGFRSELGSGACPGLPVAVMFWLF